MSEIVRDEFTKRLLTIHLAIVSRGEIRFKKEFTGTLGITADFYRHIETGERNYPQDRQKEAISSLLDTYGVNPGYMKGTSDQKFVREARPLKKAVSEETVTTNYSAKKAKQIIADQAAVIKQLQAQLEGKHATAAEPRVTYNPDNKSDKPKKK